MFDPKVKLAKKVLDKARVASQILGCATVEEFINKIVEVEADKVIATTGSKEVSAADVEDIANKLKGLGYIE